MFSNWGQTGCNEGVTRGKIGSMNEFDLCKENKLKEFAEAIIANLNPFVLVVPHC